MHPCFKPPPDNDLPSLVMAPACSGPLLDHIFLEIHERPYMETAYLHVIITYTAIHAVPFPSTQVTGFKRTELLITLPRPQPIPSQVEWVREMLELPADTMIPLKGHTAKGSRLKAKGTQTRGQPAAGKRRGQNRLWRHALWRR